MNIDDVFLQLDQGEILMISAVDKDGPFPAFGQNIMRGPGGLGARKPPH
jgi:hypothetical protein